MHHHGTISDMRRHTAYWLPLLSRTRPAILVDPCKSLPCLNASVATACMPSIPSPCYVSLSRSAHIASVPSPLRLHVARKLPVCAFTCKLVMLSVKQMITGSDRTSFHLLRVGQHTGVLFARGNQLRACEGGHVYHQVKPWEMPCRVGHSVCQNQPVEAESSLCRLPVRSWS